MKGRGLISLFLSLVSINFVSAAYFGSFSLENLLNSMDPSTMVLGVIFIISSLLINTALKRVGVFRDSTSIAGVISISLALLIIWGVNRSGIDYYGLFNGILFFVPAGMLELIWPIVFTLGAGLLIWKFGFSKTMMILGVLMIAGSFFAYDSGLLQIIGAVLIVLGLILAIRGHIKRAAFGTARGLGKGGLWATKGLGRGAGKSLEGIGKGFKNAKERLNNSTIVDEGLDWIGKKNKQRKYNNMRDAAARENSERDRVSVIVARKKEKAHDEALKMNKERDREAAIKENREIDREAAEKENRERDHDAALRENAAREQMKQKQIENRNLKLIEHKKEIEQKGEQKLIEYNETQAKRNAAAKEIKGRRSEIASLKKSIRNSSVIEQGQIETRIRQLEKEIKKIRKL